MLVAPRPRSYVRVSGPAAEDYLDSATLSPDGNDARAALAIALAAIESVDSGSPVRLGAVEQP